MLHHNRNAAIKRPWENCFLVFLLLISWGLIFCMFRMDMSNITLHYMDLCNVYSVFHVGTFCFLLWLIASSISYFLSFQACITHSAETALYGSDQA